ncbi:MAG: DUF3311 domain-containing protein [Phycisphaerales bacterium]|nr:DUF3311 domain-containing protein [Phycisphaerales bacterium]
MKRLIVVLLVLLAVLHQDFWWRNDHETVLFGFLPVSMAYHIGIAIAASVLWGLACVYCWPADAEVRDDEAWSPSGGSRGH